MRPFCDTPASRQCLRSCTQTTYWTAAFSSSVNLRHVLDQVHNTAGVAPLVVVPSDKLHKGVIQHDARLGIEGAGDGASLEVCGHESLIAVAKEALHVALRPPLDLRADLLVGRRLLQLTSQVHHRPHASPSSKSRPPSAETPSWPH